MNLYLPLNAICLRRIFARLGLLAILAASLPFTSARAADLVMDRAITIDSARDLAARRAALIQYLWGTAGFPEHRMPDSVVSNVPSPVKALNQLERVDELRMDLAPGLQGLAYHFVPQRPNSQLVVVHHGHACTLDDDPSPKDVGYGLQRTIQGLLREGYGVLGVFMPHMRPGDCSGHHDDMFKSATEGSPIKYFLEPTALSLNYLKSQSRTGHFPKYKVFHMTGLSGGGWTTTIYAAIDPRIRCSFPVAGTIPLYLRVGGSVGDREQYEPTFYRMAGYPDLYVLGAHGRGLGDDGPLIVERVSAQEAELELLEGVCLAVKPSVTLEGKEASRFATLAAARSDWKSMKLRPAI